VAVLVVPQGYRQAEDPAQHLSARAQAGAMGGKDGKGARSRRASVTKAAPLSLCNVAGGDSLVGRQHMDGSNGCQSPAMFIEVSLRIRILLLTMTLLPAASLDFGAHF
jgi:hypothetical protein